MFLGVFIINIVSGLWSYIYTPSSWCPERDENVYCRFGYLLYSTYIVTYVGSSLKIPQPHAFTVLYIFIVAVYIHVL